MFYLPSTMRVVQAARYSLCYRLNTVFKASYSTATNDGRIEPSRKLRAKLSVYYEVDMTQISKTLVAHVYENHDDENFSEISQTKLQMRRESGSLILDCQIKKDDDSGSVEEGESSRNTHAFGPGQTRNRFSKQ
jgi:hypothetical protein